MEQSSSPAQGRQVQFLLAIVHFSKFLFPVLFGGLAFCIGASMQVNMPMGWTVTLLISFPIVIFFLMPILMRLTKIIHADL